MRRKADVIVARGGEAGGHSGFISTFALVPQVVEVAADIPVVAAGGIVDGRGLAAALALGTQGVAMGTRFLASEEMAISPDWKQMIVKADSGTACRRRARRTAAAVGLIHDVLPAARIVEDTVREAARIITALHVSTPTPASAAFAEASAPR